MIEIAIYFLKLGCIGFGGPLALIALMQKELIQERKWMSEDEFRRTFSLIKAMPGPVAFQMAVFLGYQKRKFWGGLIAGLCLILPAFLLMILLGHFYQNFVEIPWLQKMMNGMQLGAFALIIWAFKSLVQGFQKKIFFWVLFISGVALSVSTSIPEPLLILLFALIAVAADKVPVRKLNSLDPLILTLASVCLKAGAFVFGTGLAIVPFLEADFVTRLGWISHQQFMDALAFGQLTPGPVTITVTFIGYKIAGLMGALVATVSVFLPAFFHMVTWFPRMVAWLHRQTWIGAFSLGATAAVCSAIAIALLHLGKGWGAPQYAMIAVLLLLLHFWKFPAWGLILLGGLLGFV